MTTPQCIYVPVASKWCAICRARSLPNRALKMYAGKSGVDCGDPISPNGITVKYNTIKRRLCYIYIQGVPGGKDLTSGECSLGQTITI